MTPRVKLLLAGGTLLLAMGITAWTLGAFTPAVGAGVDAEATCPKCQNHWELSMSKVFSEGQHDTASGWHVKCPKCSEWSPITLKKPPSAPVAEK